MADARIIIQSEPWRRSHRTNRDIGTAFSFSNLGRCVKAWSGGLAWVKDGPYAQHDRCIQIGLVSPRGIIDAGGAWPCWVVVVRGDHHASRFPHLPDDFDRWLDAWAATNGIEVVQDWRAEARQDGCAENWIWQEAHAQAAAIRKALSAEGHANG